MSCQRVFFKYCKDYNWKIHPYESILLTRSVQWGSCIILPECTFHDTSRIHTSLEMERPTTGGQLQLLVCAMKWLRSVILDFQSSIKPFHEFFKSVYTHVGKWTKRSLARTSLDTLGWLSSHTVALETCHRAIGDCVLRAHCDDAKSLCIYTDASGMHWSGMVTQVPHADLSLPHSKQRHELLAFHSEPL